MKIIEKLRKLQKKRKVINNSIYKKNINKLLKNKYDLQQLFNELKVSNTEDKYIIQDISIMLGYKKSFIGRSNIFISNFIFSLDILEDYYNKEKVVHYISKNINISVRSSEVFEYIEKLEMKNDCLKKFSFMQRKIWRYNGKKYSKSKK